MKQCNEHPELPDSCEMVDEAHVWCLVLDITGHMFKTSHLFLYTIKTRGQKTADIKGRGPIDYNLNRKYLNIINFTRVLVKACLTNGNQRVFFVVKEKATTTNREKKIS